MYADLFLQSSARSFCALVSGHREGPGTIPSLPSGLKHLFQLAGLFRGRSSQHLLSWPCSHETTRKTLDEIECVLSGCIPHVQTNPHGMWYAAFWADSVKNVWQPRVWKRLSNPCKSETPFPTKKKMNVWIGVFAGLINLSPFSKRGFPKMALVIIHFKMDFSLINHPAIKVPHAHGNPQTAAAAAAPPPPPPPNQHEPGPAARGTAGSTSEVSKSHTPGGQKTWSWFNEELVGTLLL